MNIQTFAIAYFSVGVAVHFIPPLSIYLKEEFDKIYFEYQNSPNKTYKNNLKIEFVLLGIATFISVLMFPIVIIFRLINKKKSQDNVKIETDTRRFFDPSSNCLVEEQDYEVVSNKITQIRKYSYNTNKQLIESICLDEKGAWICTRKNYYNSETYLFHETYKHKDSTADSRSFHVLDSLGRPIETYGELGGGHKYQHSFIYDSNGKQHLTARYNLARHFDLQELYKNNLREREEAERLRQKQIAEEKERERQQQVERERRVQQAKAAEREHEIVQRAKQEEEAKLQQEKAERERQANILKQQKIDQEKQAAQKQQQVLQEEQRQQAEKQRLAEKQRVALLEQQQEEVQRNFCETDTAYCADLNRLYERNPANFKFATIRSLTSDCGVWQELENGVKQLDTYEQLNQYIFSYGLMHQAKLQQAYHSIFSNNHLPLSGQPIEIIDYGCGQGIGTVCFIDYIKEQTNRNCNIAKVKLIEPSVLALKRAVLNTRYSLKSFNQLENVFAVNKELDDVSSQDIDTQASNIKIHIFSNIIDVEDFDLYQLYHKIQSTQTGMNIFICVSPNIMESRNLRLDRFQQYFVSKSGFALISSRESDIPNPRNPEKSYKRYERIFKVQLGEVVETTAPVVLTRPSRFVENDDLPF